MSTTRRQVLAGLVVAPIAFARSKTEKRRAKFEEAGEHVRMTLALPGLISLRDTDALKSIDSSFDTTLRYSLRLLRYGSDQLISSRTVVVKIRRDPWKKRYVVSRRSGGGWTKRFFEERNAAIAAATTLERQIVGPVDQLERTGDGPYYYVRILGLRNPIEHADDDSGDRGRGRDLYLFSRLVDSMAGERPRAEKEVRLVTNAFYLLP